MNKYDFVANMTAKEFTKWFDNLSISQTYSYLSYLYSIAAESGVDMLEFIHSEYDDDWKVIHPATYPTTITMYYCRVKTQPKEQQYEVSDLINPGDLQGLPPFELMTQYRLENLR